jgi:hypothetical protein
MASDVLLPVGAKKRGWKSRLLLLTFRAFASEIK